MIPRKIFILAVAAGLAATTTASAQRAACDSTLVRLASASNGYRDRGTRCEGMYAQQVAGTILIFASFTTSFEPYRADQADTMIVEWPATVRDSVTLRAEALRRGQYYRMDAIQAANKSFRWPSRLLSAQQIRGTDLGIIGWTRAAAGDVYVPLSVRTADGTAACGGYNITLLPGERLDEVYVTLVPLDAEGRPGTPARNQQALARGPYPAEIPIRFRIAREEIGQAGVYRLRIDARRSGGGTSSLEKLLSLGSRCGS